MPTSIQIATTDKASTALQSVGDDRALRGRVMQRLVREWDKAGQVVVGNAVKHRFTGAGPFPAKENRLGVVSGRLRRSIRSTRPQINLSTGDMVLTMGSNVSYFAVHEFGKRGKVQVKGHTRRNIGRGKVVGGKLTKASQRAMVRQRKAGGPSSSQVRPHSRRVDIPARAPLGTEIRSERGRGEFIRATNRALADALKVKGGQA